MHEDRLRLRFWDKEECQYLKPSFFDSIWFDKDGGIHVGCYSDIVGKVVDYTNEVDIEQCIGLKDKNGNLIYEGDLLTDGRDTGHVLWRGSGWGCTAFLWKKKPETLKICGNIHEQAEQKE